MKTEVCKMNRIILFIVTGMSGCLLFLNCATLEKKQVSIDANDIVCAVNDRAYYYNKGTGYFH
jgi:hypothetical protein